MDDAGPRHGRRFAASGLGCLRSWGLPGLAPADMHQAMGCVRFITLVSVPLSLLLLWMLRRGCLLWPGRTAAIAGLAAAGGGGQPAGFVPQARRVHGRPHAAHLDRGPDQDPETRRAFSGKGPSCASWRFAEPWSLSTFGSNGSSQPADIGISSSVSAMSAAIHSNSHVPVVSGALPSAMHPEQGRRAVCSRRLTPQPAPSAEAYRSAPAPRPALNARTSTHCSSARSARPPPPDECSHDARQRSACRPPPRSR